MGMEVLTPKSNRRSTRVRVEIPVSVVSLDRMRPFAERCELLVVSAQGCGFRSSRALQMETPIMIGDLPGGGSVTVSVANCLSLGNDGKHFLIGASLYTHGNVWRITDAPEDWSIAAKDDPALAAGSRQGKALAAAAVDAPASKTHKQMWPYNIFSEGAEAHPGRK